MNAVFAPTALIHLRTASATNSGPLSDLMNPRHAAQDEQIRQRVDHLDRVQLSLHPDCQAFARKLIQYVQRPERLAIVRSTVDEVVRPDVVPVLRSQPNARTVRQPQASLLWLLHWYFQPLSSPEPFDAAVTHRPPGIPQQRCDPPIAIPTVLSGQFDHVRDQPVFISTAMRHASLCGTVLTKNTASSALRDIQFSTDTVDTGPTASGAQKFPLAASVRMSLSRVRSETARRSRSFSF